MVGAFEFGINPDPNGMKELSYEIASSDGKHYWLNVNGYHCNYRFTNLIKMGVPWLLRFFFALVGQPYAKQTIVKDITCHLANQEKYRRMVFVLGGGPVGHGKTISAKDVAEILGGEASKDFLKVSLMHQCQVGFWTFWSIGGVQRRQDWLWAQEFCRESPIQNRYCADQKFTDALFTIFDKGEWVDKKSSSACKT